METLRTNTLQSRSFVVALIGMFVLSLGLPRVGALRHDHAGGEHAHVHAEFAESPAALLHTHRDDPASQHSHPQPHVHHDHAAHDLHNRSHSHAHAHHHKVTAKKERPAKVAFHQPKTSPGMHWHAVNVFQHATATQLALLLPTLSAPPLPVLVHTFPFLRILPVCQPRAPPSATHSLFI
ncbi:MAG: hypothetical protein FJ147_09490 [Deltaproteobacteria bacterium]|nr:hypothetical protein [Deltaproteobacteria bacterium]